MCCDIMINGIQQIAEAVYRGLQVGQIAKLFFWYEDSEPEDTLAI